MRIGAAPLALIFLFVSGCGSTRTVVSTPGNVSTATAGATITGKVRGGQSPISGAEVFLFAANNTGFGQPSVSLLKSVPGSTTLDSSGGATNGDYFVTTDSNGNFSITGDYTCTSGQQVYLYAFGGNPGLSAGTNNTSLSLMAVLGNCPVAGNFLSTDPTVIVNEVTTVAAATALVYYAPDALHVSAPNDTGDQTALANAFADSTLLANIATGQALATTPQGNGIAPQALVNTLGNILASCVDSNGAVTGPTSPTNCYTLFNNSYGKTSQPTDTATAAINMARFPGTNIGPLFGLATAVAPFSPADATQPNDFSMSVAFPLNVTGPVSLAADGLGNVWLGDKGGNKVSKISPQGQDLLDITKDIANPTGIAVTSNNNVFVANSGGSGSVVGLTNSGTELAGSPFTLGGISNPIAIANDPSDNLWILNGNSTVSEISITGAAISPSGGYIFGPSAGQPNGIAADSYGNAFVSDYPNNAIYEFDPGPGIFLQPVFISNINGPQGMQADTSGNVWFVNSGNNDLDHLVDTGPGYGNISATGFYPIGVTGAGVVAGGPVAPALIAEGATPPAAPVAVVDANSVCVDVPFHPAPAVTTTNTTHFCPSTAPASSTSDELENSLVNVGQKMVFTSEEFTEAKYMMVLLNIKLPK
jgi:sugar lactone lactonase YvrE